jgi:hypothetical protein
VASQLRGNANEQENYMSKLTLRTFWILTLFATGVIAGCSGQASAPPNPTIASTLVTAFHDSGVGCNYTETGSNIGLVNGNIYTAPPPPAGACLEDGTATTFDIATQAACDANIAFLDLNAASRPGGTDPAAQGNSPHSLCLLAFTKPRAAHSSSPAEISLWTHKATPTPSGCFRPPARSLWAMRAFPATCC